ncbi:damage-inducible protein DinB [Christiangramia fulva]|uniref:Damage-inducible protein DinB n=1 Tax=Christiangramia fulva TaxID=2126553 RepID=A0A2R3Z6A8_9FLAO|nr:DinB family protein [Christiangramia fulva]AVR45752.1 damage-inducible protein DinB [Christiangramia fulva]
MKEFLKELFEYSHHFNIILINKFNDGDLEHVISERSENLMSHILNAQKIWNSRIRGDEIKTDVWKKHGKKELEALENRNYENSMEILKNDDLERVVVYQNSKGVSYKNRVRDILFHIINHSTYHRGQLATDFRNDGIDPVVSDYIFYKR